MRIFCRGFNLFDQLNHTETCLVDFQHILELDNIKQFLLGYSFSVLLTSNTLKILCKLAVKNSVNCENIGIIKMITAGEDTLLILNDKGQLFKASILTWEVEGMPKFTQGIEEASLISCNQGIMATWCKSGCLYNFLEKLQFQSEDIIDVQTGIEHCLLLDKMGNVYTFGAGSRGQLGNGQLDEQPNPVLVEALAGIKITKIAAGGWHSAAISDQGDLYTWGWNNHGQLGLAKKETISVMATPQVIDIQDYPENNVIDVACGHGHTVVLLDNQALYGCGWNKYKQLKNTSEEDCLSLVHIHDLSTEIVEKVTCGPWNTAIIVR